MNILLIDDHFCAREGVACLLKRIFPELQLFEAESLDEGLAIARDTPLNLVLLDIQLPGKDGLTGLVELRLEFPNLCVTMFSGLDDRELVFEALLRVLYNQAVNFETTKAIGIEIKHQPRFFA
jgi:two-component system, NarL family, nitrate/nitrite response regulator NarL